MKLSLCMIVKNEESMLAECLASVQGVVDQIVVVDTGSKDQTIAIAKQFNATVVHHVWNDDFSAARNAALPHAIGDWILVLDADERLAPGASKEIFSFMRNPSYDLGMMPLHNASRIDASITDILNGTARRGEPILLPRLLRKTPDLAWKSVVHENVSDWVAKRLKRCKAIPAAIVHLGCVPSLREARDKSERNIRLLLKRAEQEPDNALTYMYLSSEYRQINDDKSSHRYARKAWSTLQRTFEQTVPRPSPVECATLRGRLYLLENDPVGVHSVIKQAKDWGSKHPNLHFLDARAYELEAVHARSSHLRKEKSIAALREYQKCLEMDGLAFPEELIVGATNTQARYRIARCLLMLDQCEEAYETLSKLTAELNHFDSSLSLAECLVRLGRPTEALTHLEPYMTSQHPDPWVIAAYACEALGQLNDMAQFLNTAKDRNVDSFACYETFLLYRELEAAVALYQGSAIPSHCTAGVVGLIVQRRPTVRRWDQGCPILPHRIQILVQNLWNQGNSSAIEAMLEPRAEQLAPEIHRFTQNALAAMDLQATDDGISSPVIIGGGTAAERQALGERLSQHPCFRSQKKRQCILVDQAQPIPHARWIWLEKRAPEGLNVLLLPRETHHHPESVLRSALAWIGEPWTDLVLGPLSSAPMTHPGGLP